MARKKSNLCAWLGCGKPTGYTYCVKHFTRWYYSDIASRFKSRVVESEGCWIWVGSVGSRGYGQMRCNRKQKTAHRLAWELANGEIPTGLHVCHRCDNKLCVRVDHLFVGTAADNMHDRDRKGRHVRHMLGKRHTAEARLKMRAARKAMGRWVATRNSDGRFTGGVFETA